MKEKKEEPLHKKNPFNLEDFNKFIETMEGKTLIEHLQWFNSQGEGLKMRIDKAMREKAKEMQYEDHACEAAIKNSENGMCQRYCRICGGEM